MKNITIKGARTHNLKNIELTIPRDKLVVITGLSGSGKSSLAFDTLYAEGQRRYVESLSTYARQFLSVMEKPDVDHIEGLSPAISIEQKSTSHNPRSTVGTVTEIYDYLRLLFARVGTPKCPEHNVTLDAQTISQMVDELLDLPENTKINILAPVVQNKKGEQKQIIESLQAQGYIRARINGHITELEESPKLDKNKKHSIEVVVDRLKIKEDINTRVADSLETALQLSDGIVVILIDDSKELIFSAKYSCNKCGYSLQELEPRIFSFNNPIGACDTCDGLGSTQAIDLNKIIFDDTLSLSSGAIRGWGSNNFYYFSMLQALAEFYEFDLNKPFKKLPKKIKDIILFGGNDTIDFVYKSVSSNNTFKKSQVFEGIVNNMMRRYKSSDSQSVKDDIAKFMSKTSCNECGGARLNTGARHVFIKNHSLTDVTSKSILQAKDFFDKLEFKGKKAQIAEKILKEISARLKFLVNVGLDYLTLSRSAETLSGGEAQRIRLASQIGAGLVGVMYVLDEPSIGLHQRDNERLINTLIHRRDLGNTVIVVEHDEDAIKAADFVIDIGPGAGVHGGEVVAFGTPKQIIKNNKSLTGKYLAKKEQIAIPKTRTKINGDMLTLKGASGNNLKDVTLEIPLKAITCVTGVSGSGKSTLINSTLYPIAAHKLNNAKNITISPYTTIEGIEQLDKVVDISQSPIGRTPRSNAATYTGLFTDIRDLFASTKEAKARGYKVGRFSFNVKGGRCESCSGDGLIKVEMHFLADVYVMCDVCKGKRYNRETLEVHYKGKNINDVLNLTVEEALKFLNAIPSINRKLQTLMDVGLDYITLGQSATTFSGGEAQRIKLSKELSKRDTGRTLYILDEPTTGLHFHDIKRLLDVLKKLHDRGNTIVIIEHNLDVIKTADWIIDLGPEGGDGGGQIIAKGTPEDIAKSKTYTGQFLKTML